MKITDIEVIELRVPGWRGDSFDGSRDDCVIRRGRLDAGHRARRHRGVSLSDAALAKFKIA
jgi:hypothetical protein